MGGGGRRHDEQIVCTFLYLILLLFCAGSAFASNIVEITVDEIGIPFVLDDEGHVWGFRKPHSLEDPIKLPNLNHIQKIASYIAVDVEGRVFTWSINDAEVVTIEGEIDEAGYTAPQRFGDLKGVTLVAYSGRHFVAVIGNRDIFDWVEIPSKIGDRFGIDGYGPIRTISSRPGVSAIAAATKGETVPTGRAAITKFSYGLEALFEDGTVMGWGITPTGEVTEDIPTSNVLLTKSPGAIGIAMNGRHTIILSAQGIPQFWGGCEVVEKDVNGHLLPKVGVHAVDGNVTDIIGMAIPQNDDLYPNAFIKRDGTVWVEYSPIPANISGVSCSQFDSSMYYRQAEQLPAGHAAAVQVTTAGGVYLMLDGDHKIWTTGLSYGKKKFHNVPINLK